MVIQYVYGVVVPYTEPIKPKILTFVSYYLPGFKAGGPITTIRNLVAQLGNEYEFMIVTRDHDRGDLVPYQDIHPNQWNCLDGVKIFYLATKKNHIATLYRIFAECPHDIVYLNSFFDFKLSIIPNLIRKFSGSNNLIILAPRGEFSSGALSIKRARKLLFIWWFKWFGMSKNLIFQASSEYEKEDIKRTLNVSDKIIKIASDLPSVVESCSVKQKEIGCTKIIFLSRISPIKNLKYAVQSLQHAVSPIVFNIYGPLEDRRYWEECKRLLNNLPENITWHYCGVARPVDVKTILAEHDLMFLPTLGENYGHVIAESIAVGTPVLISDRTPWRGLEHERLGWDLDLADQSGFTEKIDDFARQSPAQKAQLRQIILGKAAEILYAPEQIEENRALFKCSLQLNKG